MITFQSTLSVRRATVVKMACTPSIPFQSTLSVRRATNAVSHVRISDIISIHALRKESDSHVHGLFHALYHFNPRSP